MTPIERLKVVNQYIGFGNPNSKLWFIGSEEKGEWNDDKELENYKNTPIKEGTIIGANNPTYQGYVKIINKLIDGNFSDKDYFVSNLWPIGIDKKNNEKKDFSQATRKYFGFDDNTTYHEILGVIKHDRFFALEMFFKICDWKAKTIFCCVGNDNEFYLNEFMQGLTYDSNLNFDNTKCPYVSILKNYKRIFQPYHGSRINTNFPEAIKFIRNELS